MLDEDRKEAEELLKMMEWQGQIFPGYHLKRDNRDDLYLLGCGSAGFIFEVQDENDHDYVLKMLGFGISMIEPKQFKARIEEYNGALDGNAGIVHVIDAKQYVVEMDEHGIVQIKDYVDGQEGIVIQLLLFEKFSAIIKRKGKTACLQRKELSDEIEICEFAIQIGTALTLLHKRQYIHGDVTLDNLLWDENEHRYVLGDIDTIRGAGTVYGAIAFTDGYSAPEIKNLVTNHYDERVDIYAFGVCLFLLCNDLRFPNSEGYYVNPKQYAEGYAFPMPKNASKRLGEVIGRMCAYDCTERYQSMEEVLGSLQQIWDSIEKKGFWILVECNRGADYCIWIPA